MKEERARILEMVKNGKITIDEAETLLDALENINEAKEQKEKQIEKELSPIVQFEQKQSESDTEEQKTYTNSSYSSQSTKDKLLNLFDTAMKKIKDLDLDFHHSVQVTHVFQKNIEEMKQIFIDVPNGNVQLYTWDHEDVRIECDAKVYREEDPGLGKERFLKETDFQTSNHTLIYRSKDKFINVNAKIFVPKHEYENLEMKLFNGSITVEDFQVKDVDLKTANGKIKLEGVEGIKGEVETANGEITVTNGIFKTLEVETLNGKVTVEGSYENLHVQTIGGTINSTVTNENPDTIRLQSATGSIYVRISNELAIRGELKSIVGNVHVELDDIHRKEEKNDIIQKLLKFEKHTATEKRLFLLADSKTGSVFVQPLQ
ncbi:DUF4097 family beta strand repeat-containing protein [Caldibacillus lycopersici]|uniref:DUF4097 family beta strand repeat-containing protein n=1 Tax=Perspicuibacillus lycopersici TaxID=1325689 RepID=A0AAE3IR66_9BACI|nr:DUF4097 domain-containing protein [Perspicuibacillus lycopersici]MCU9612931.1 DUF4097 family beta strand repeat-containing protein [Perspicuibacillus lycopersici]